MGAWDDKLNLTCFEPLKYERPWTLETYSRIGGYEAWVGRVSVAQQGATPVTLVAVWIRRSPDQMFQILGTSATPGDVNEARIAASARSLRNLTDPAKLDVSPDRLQVVTVNQPGTFEEVVKLDYVYVTNWSLWWDIKILVQTLPVVLNRRGDY